MTEKEIRKRNDVSFFLLGIGFAGLGIHDLWDGKLVPGTLFLTSGAVFFVQIVSERIKKKNHRGKTPFPPESGSGKKG